MSLVSIYNCTEVGSARIPEICPECGLALGVPLNKEGNFWYKDTGFHAQYFAAQYCCPDCSAVLAQASDFQTENDRFLVAFQGESCNLWRPDLYESKDEAKDAARRHKRDSLESLGAYRLPSELRTALSADPVVKEQFLDLLQAVMTDVATGNFSDIDLNPATETQKAGLKLMEAYFEEECAQESESTLELE